MGEKYECVADENYQPPRQDCPKPCREEELTKDEENCPAYKCKDVAPPTCDDECCEAVATQSKDKACPSYECKCPDCVDEEEPVCPSGQYPKVKETGKCKCKKYECVCSPCEDPCDCPEGLVAVDEFTSPCNCVKRQCQTKGCTPSVDFKDHIHPEEGWRSV